jgi:hypothetical protein
MLRRFSPTDAATWATILSRPTECDGPISSECEALVREEEDGRRER